MIISKDLLVGQETFFIQSDNSSACQVNSGEFYDLYFLRQLHLETLRAQRSKSTLSIIVLTLDKEANLE
ncbi:MAG: sugar transferase, partial [Methylobacter sp.]